MIRQWDEFQLGPNVRTGDAPRVTLNIRGIFTLNMLAFNALGQPEAVVLLFDRVNSLIGLRKAAPEARNAYPAQKQGKNNNWLIRGKVFCQHNKIRITNTVVFHNIEVDDDSVMVLNLRDVSDIAPRTTKPKGENRGLFVLGSANG